LNLEEVMSNVSKMQDKDTSCELLGEY